MCQETSKTCPFFVAGFIFFKRSDTLMDESVKNYITLIDLSGKWRYNNCIDLTDK